MSFQGDLDLPHSYQMSLLDGDLTNAENIAECTEAAKALLQAMNVKLHPCKLSDLIRNQIRSNPSVISSQLYFNCLQVC